MNVPGDQPSEAGPTAFDPNALRAVRAWSAGFGGHLDALDYLGQVVGPTGAVAAIDLFWPRFVEVRGCVLRARAYSAERFEEWWSSLEGDTRRIEAVVSHLHLWDVFDDPGSVPPEALRRLADVLAHTWRAALAQQFPGRAFDVTVSDEQDGEHGPTLSVISGAAG